MSSSVAQLFCNTLPVVESKRVIALSVEEAGHTTSPDPATTPHFTPVASAESAIRIVPFAPTASREAVLAPVPTARSPFASHIESVATDPPPHIVSILSYTAFFVGTSRDQFHPTQYASSGTEISPVNVPPDRDA